MQTAAELSDILAINRRNCVSQLANHYASAPAAGVYDLQRLGPEPQYDQCNGVDHPSPGPDNGDEAAIGSDVAPQWI